MVGYRNNTADPCFNWNNSAYCCSEGNRQLYRNLALNEALAKATLRTNSQDHSYNIARNYGENNSVGSLELQTSGLIVPSAYSFPSLGKWEVKCSRMPCGIYNTPNFPCVPK